MNITKFIKCIGFLLYVYYFSLGCSLKDYEALIVQKWELEEVTDSIRVRKVKEESLDEEAGTEVYYLNFYEDGHLEAYLFDRQIRANYTISNKKLILEEEDSDTPPIQLKILELNHSNLVLEYLENGKPVKLKFGLR